MDIIEYRQFCLSLPETGESTPFDEDTLVIKVSGKMFTLASISSFDWIVVKCTPEDVISNCERYAEVVPAFHMNKKYWISLPVEGDVPDGEIRKLLVDSYKLVVGKLPKYRQEEIRRMDPSLWQ